MSTVHRAVADQAWKWGITLAVFLCGFLVSGTMAAAATVVYIDPQVSATGDGSIAAPYKSWYDVPWAPGTSYLQKAGSVFDGSFTVSVQGTKENPVVIGSYGEGSAPIINGTIMLSGAAYVTIDALTLQNSIYAGVGFTEGAHHNTVKNSTLRNNTGGVWFSESAGGANLIIGNTIRDSKIHGVAFDKTPGSAGNENRIDGNTITDNGSHGVMLHTNHVQVTNNFIAGNGEDYPGSSGIQVYAQSLAQSLGRNNTITGNISIENRDTQGNDGGGILMDHYTAGTVVKNNFTYANDGMGIVIYGSADNTVSDNVSIGNSVSRSGSHVLRAEYAVSTDIPRLGAGLTHGNRTDNNTMISLRTAVAAVYVDPESSTLDNTFKGNDYWIPVNGTLFTWGSETGKEVARFNTVARASDALLSQFSTKSGFDYKFPEPIKITIGSNTHTLLGWKRGTGLVVKTETVTPPPTTTVTTPPPVPATPPAPPVNVADPALVATSTEVATKRALMLKVIQLLQVLIGLLTANTR